MKLKGEVAVVTGAASGIGRATAMLFSKEGAKVCIADIDERRGSKLVDQINSSKKDPYGASALYVKANVTVEAEVRSLFELAEDELGKPTILVTAAGTNIEDMNIVNYNMEKWDWLLNLNLRSVVLCCKYALKSMNKGKKGAIINIASTAGIEAIPKLGAYCATKAAVIMLTKVMALECARNNIRVNCVCPGNTVTPLLKMAIKRRLTPEQKKLGLNSVMKEQQKVSPIGRWARPEEIAEVALFLALKDSSFVTGHALVADGGYLAGRLGGDTGLISRR